MMNAPDHNIEEKKEKENVDRESPQDSKETLEGIRLRKKTASLPRSDSIGSGSGRKYLAPTLSDPAARPDKERLSAKKKNNRTTGK